LEKGFGWPVIESISQGKPVFLSKETALPEFGGDLAFYFESFQAEEMANYIQEKLSLFSKNAVELRGKLKDQAAKFSWENCLNAYLNYYSDIHSMKK